MPARPGKSRVLIVDDEPAVRNAHAKLVESWGHEVETASDGLEALAKLALDPDLVLLNLHMAGMDGLEVVKRIRETPGRELLPIVVVTGFESFYERAMQVGANDVILKPLNPSELRLRCRWLLELKAANDRLHRERDKLDKDVAAATGELRLVLEETSRAERRVRAAHRDTIRRLAIAAEFKDEDAAGHIRRVGRSAEILGRAVGLGPTETEHLRHAAQMHDVGKIGIPDSVLLKRGPPTTPRPPSCGRTLRWRGVVGGLGLGSHSARGAVPPRATGRRGLSTRTGRGGSPSPGAHLRGGFLRLELSVTELARALDLSGG